MMISFLSINLKKEARILFPGWTMDARAGEVLCVMILQARMMITLH